MVSHGDFLCHQVAYILPCEIEIWHVASNMMDDQLECLRLFDHGRIRRHFVDVNEELAITLPL